MLRGEMRNQSERVSVKIIWKNKKLEHVNGVETE